jgi:hypothetical protein
MSTILNIVVLILLFGGGGYYGYNRYGAPGLVGKAVGDAKLQSEGESDSWKARSRMPSAGSRTRSETP